MQTVNFNCSFCGKLMAVGLNLVGRNVRCPHCKQVVQAPAKTSAPTLPPSAPSFQLPPVATEGHESIFGETPSDDLFGGGAPPQSTMPEKPAPRPFSDTAPIDPFRSSPPHVSSTRDVDAPTIDLPSSPLAGREPWPEQRAGGSPTEEIPEPLPEDEPEAPEEVAPRAVRRQPAVRESGGGGIFVWILLLYALAATGAAAYLFYDKTQNEAGQTSQRDGKDHPYLAIPDLFGQYDRAERRKVVKIKEIPDNLAVPERLRVKLAQSLAVGDIEVVPLKVEYRQIARYRKLAGQAPFLHRPTEPPTLCLLYLKIKNTSDDVYFCPTDPAFARRKESRPVDVKPYTGLVIGDKEPRFLPGGAFLWPDSDFEYEYVDGQQDDVKPLGPKEERIYVIPADMDNIGVKDLLKEARNKQLPIMWRVQLRRGLDKVKDISGNEREISVSSVIGVVLDSADFPF
jgi:phage FluMu protein Com